MTLRYPRVSPSRRTTWRRRIEASSIRPLGTALFFAVLLLVAFPVAALAHAKPISSNPSPNQNLTTAPTSITITFGQHVKPDGSDIVVYDKDGKKVSTSPATADTADLTKMTVPMQGDDSESYLVVWHTVSADDGEAAIGAFQFGVNAKADDLPSPAATAQGASPLIVALIGIAGIVIGGAGGYFFSRRQRSAPSSGS